MKKMNFLERLFPTKYNFYEMITEQAKVNAQGVAALENWLKLPSHENADSIRALALQADEVRFRMESCLIEAFVTPFDRQDIYSLSVEMDRIIEYANSTLELMLVYEVSTDQTVLDMIADLSRGTRMLYQAIALLENEPSRSREIIPDLRRCQITVEERYRSGSAKLFKSEDLIKVIEIREVYHHIKDAAVHLGYTVDVLHKIVVRII